MKKTAISEEVLATVLLLNKKSKKRLNSLEESHRHLEEFMMSYPAPIPGPAGPQGNKGEIGDRGLPGMPGPEGEKGEKGDQGIQGEKGDVGAIGPQGNIGPKGDKGDQGDKGEIGPIGPQGIPGPQGLKGDKGDRGEAGPPGVQGLKGEKGDVGKQGPPGTKGNKGDRGLRGYKGAVGKQGPVGPRGPAGEQGDPGVQGPPGEKGEPGVDGAPGDIEEPIHKLNHEFSQLRNKLITHINTALTNVAMAGGGGGSAGGGSVNILDNDDVVFERLENVLNNSVLVFDTELRKFRAVSIVDLINSVRQELEIKYTKLVDNVGTISYIGEALPGTAESAASWRIFRFDESSDPDLEIKWADGDAEFDKVWTDRATYTYS